MSYAGTNRRQFLVTFEQYCLGLAWVSICATLKPLWAQTPSSKREPDQCSVEAKVKHAVFEQFGVEEKDLTRRTSFAEDLKADSLDIVELTTSLEDVFGMEIPDKDCAKLHSVGSLTDYISARLSKTHLAGPCSRSATPGRKQSPANPTTKK